MENYASEHCNCATLSKCDLQTKYECCKEKGNDKLGIMCVKGTCDKNTGTCTKINPKKRFDLLMIYLLLLTTSLIIYLVF